MYNFYIDYRTIAISPGNPTSIVYTTHSIRTLQNPIRVYISGITGGCSILNGSYMATVVSQTSGVGGTLSIPVDTTGLACSSGKPVMASSAAKCNLCNAAAGGSTGSPTQMPSLEEQTRRGRRSAPHRFTPRNGGTSPSREFSIPRVTA